MGKLGYKKSRNGCDLCKQRRVKCDEKIPCTACVKHSAQCSLLFSPTPQAEPKKPTRPRRRPQRRAESETSSQRCSSPTPGTAQPSDRPSPSILSHGFPPDLSPISEESWVTDLELMHHYSTVTYATFPASSRADDAFKERLPQVGFRYPYLLHQVLAISAFHLAYLRPESRQKYMIRASQHQSKSITGIREALQTEMTEETSYPIFATSAYLMGTTFASYLGAQDSDSNADALDKIIEVMTLLRGTEAISARAAERLNRRPSEHLFANTPTGALAGPSSLHDVIDQLHVLKTHVRDATAVDLQNKQTIEDGIQALINDLNVNPVSRIMESPELRVVFHWPMELSGGFLTLLRSRDPAALVVLLYYCVVFNSTEHGCWFLEGWSVAVARSIHYQLCENPWDQLAQWPLQQIRGLAL